MLPVVYKACLRVLHQSFREEYNEKFFPAAVKEFFKSVNSVLMVTPTLLLMGNALAIPPTKKVNIWDGYIEIQCLPKMQQL